VEGKVPFMKQLRGLVVPLAAIAAVLLVYMENPWVGPEAISAEFANIVTLAFWALAIVVAVLLFSDRSDPQADVVEVEGPAFTRFLFSNTRAGLFWLPIRLFLGFEWLSAGIHKLFPDGKPVGAGWLDGGGSLAGYWNNAVQIPDAGRPPITFEWYRGLLQFMIDNDFQVWFGYLVVFGEIAIGIGLLLGVLVGIASFFGATLNMSFLLAGTSSSNPVMFALAIGLIMAWRVAGWYGLDRWLLPILGTPWTRRVGTHAAGPVGATSPGS
jgi:thiosulfate dehydrogenase [quinone] large subunit